MNLLVSKWIRSCEGGGEEVMPACHVGTALETWSSSGGGSLRHCWIPGGCEALLICWNKLLCKKCRWALCDSKQNVIRCVLVDSSAGTQKPLPQIAILASSLTLSWKEQGGYMCWVGWGGIMFTVVTDCHRVICSLCSAPLKSSSHSCLATPQRTTTTLYRCSLHILELFLRCHVLPWDEEIVVMHLQPFSIHVSLWLSKQFSPSSFWWRTYISYLIPVG